MRTKTSSSALVFLLAANLLFNQVGLNFFHNKHDAHEVQQKLTDQAQFHRHGDHCKVCAIDTLFNLFFLPAARFNIQQTTNIVLEFYSVNAEFVAVRFTRDRAPPIALS